MKRCSKCNSFYDDKALGYCLIDGFPLDDIGDTDQQWLHGREVLREQNRILRRREFREKGGKITRTILLFVIVIMILTVTVLWSWVIINRPQTETSPPVAVVKSTEPDPLPGFTTTGLNTPTPVPTPTRPREEETRTPTPKPTNSPTDDAPVCTSAKKRTAENEVRISRYGPLVQDVLEIKRNEILAHFRGQHDLLREVRIDLVYQDVLRFDVEAVDCESVRVSIKSEFKLNRPYEIPVRALKTEVVYLCTKAGTDWKCKL